ncbi:8-oxoguanine DNA glycosylase OGG fold protein [Streptomyces phaeofaciens]
MVLVNLALSVVGGLTSRPAYWSPHRYAVYLSFMHAAARQVAASGSWPSDASPDLLEYTLFTTTWQASG